MKKSRNIFNTIINPKSIAVVGASRSPEKVGYQILNNLIKSKFTGKIYPINPNAQSILKTKVFPTVNHVRKSIDLAVIVTPKGLVAPVVQDCIQAKIPAAIIITAGFAESGQKGKREQQQLAKLSQGKIRLLGPNCLGVMSTTNHLNATFGPQFDQVGDIMLISQSGAMVTGVLDWSKISNLGISHTVSFGNRMDVSENDALSFAARDPKTKIVLVYLESFRNAPEFFSIASTITPKKPIILLKGGISKSGQAASASHTAALATDHKLVSAFAHQTGVILADDIHHWLRMAEMFKKTKKSLGADLAIITNAGGPGVVASDEAESNQLVVKPISGKTKKLLNKSLSHIPVHNPLDIRGDATPEDFATAINALKHDQIQDALIIIITPQTTTQPSLAAQKIIEQVKTSKKPIVVVLLGGGQMLEAKQLLDQAGVVNYTFPSEAVKLLAAKISYQNQASTIKPFPSRFTKTSDFKQITPENLNLKLSFRLLKSYGFSLPKFQIISQIQYVPKAMKMVHRPAIIKTASMHIAHKVLSGGVVQNIHTNQAARMAFRQMQALDQFVLFQQTIQANTEVILGAKRDPQFGPFLTVGLGGSFTDALADRQYAFLPTSTKYFESILKQTKLFQRIKSNPKNIKQVIEAMKSVQAIILNHPEISELEINPLLLTSTKAYAVDIKITLV